ncbi:MAG: hypothetical protein KKE17_09145 [Proteobacteria bacterium]|nr:hypothetical protein [Pseudomonadota bacterium]MBU1710154.1 hypothetical protein [Pseudomonadota bacterium]
MSTVYIKTLDAEFAQMLCRTIEAWKIYAIWHEEAQDSWEDPNYLLLDNIDVVLLDIRCTPEKAVRFLHRLRQKSKYVEVILLNTSDRVNASMDGMQAGASDELTVPFDTDTLKKKFWKPVVGEKNRSKGGEECR